MWHKSSYSNGGTCVEVAELPDGGRAVRDSKDRTPSRGSTVQHPSPFGG